jgi:hypothetical protein
LHSNLSRLCQRPSTSERELTSFLLIGKGRSWFRPLPGCRELQVPVQPRKGDFYKRDGMSGGFELTTWPQVNLRLPWVVNLIVDTQLFSTRIQKGIGVVFHSSNPVSSEKGDTRSPLFRRIPQQWLNFWLFSLR